MHRIPSKQIFILRLSQYCAHFGPPFWASPKWPMEMFQCRWQLMVKKTVNSCQLTTPNWNSSENCFKCFCFLGNLVVLFNLKLATQESLFFNLQRCFCWILRCLWRPLGHDSLCFFWLFPPCCHDGVFPGHRVGRGLEDLSVALVEELEGRDDDADWEIEVPTNVPSSFKHGFIWWPRYEDVVVDRASYWFFGFCSVIVIQKRNSVMFRAFSPFLESSEGLEQRPCGTAIACSTNKHCSVAWTQERIDGRVGNTRIVHCDIHNILNKITVIHERNHVTTKFWFWSKPWVEAFPRGWWSSAVVKFTCLNICDRSVPWMKLPTPCYPGISWYLFGNLGNQTKGCVFFFGRFRKTKVFWHDAFGCLYGQLRYQLFSSTCRYNMLPPKNQPSPVAYDRGAHHFLPWIGGRVPETYIGNCGWRKSVFLPGLLALLPTLRRTLDDGCLCCFIYSFFLDTLAQPNIEKGELRKPTTNEAIGWSFGLLVLQSVGHQGCQTFSFSQEPGANTAGVSTSQENPAETRKTQNCWDQRVVFRILFQMGTW